MIWKKYTQLLSNLLKNQTGQLCNNIAYAVLCDMQIVNAYNYLEKIVQKKASGENIYVNFK